MSSGHERWQKTTFICSAIKQKWYESGRLDTGGSEGGEYECWLRIPGGEDLGIWLERSGQEKFKPKQKYHFKVKTNKSADSLIVRVRIPTACAARSESQQERRYSSEISIWKNSPGMNTVGPQRWIWPDAAELNVWGWTSLPKGGRGRCNAAFPSVPIILRADTLLYELLRSP